MISLELTATATVTQFGKHFSKKFSYVNLRVRDVDGPAMRCEPGQHGTFTILFAESGSEATKEVRSVPISVPHLPRSGMRIHDGAVIDADQWVAAAQIHSPRLG